ncbi:hypothetical protein Taro_004972, partial [Colocasia esculenta]|nr:hypothetical protein [Colocasia esculenta]
MSSRSRLRVRRSRTVDSMPGHSSEDSITGHHSQALIPTTQGASSAASASSSIAERMTQMMTPSLQSDDVTPVSTKDAFIAGMGQDMSHRVCCTDKAKTLCTWYRRGEGLSSSDGYHT